MKNIIILALGMMPIMTTMAYPTLQRRITPEIERITDEILFDITIDQFEARRNAQDPAELDWTSDGCSQSPDNPAGFNFVPSCHRHDFSYRNYKKQDRFTDGNKAKIDSNFKKDLDNQCEQEDHKIRCLLLAEVYYEAVRTFGSK